MCLFGDSPCICIPYVINQARINWQHAGVVHLSLHLDAINVAFEDIPVFGVCRSALHDSS